MTDRLLPTRQGLTFLRCLEEASKNPELLERFAKLLGLWRPATHPIDRVIDQQCFTAEELQGKRDRTGAALGAAVFRWVWQTFPPLPEEDNELLALHDQMLEQRFRAESPEVWG